MKKAMLNKELCENLYESKGYWMIAGVSLIFTMLCILATTVKEVTAYSQTEILQYALKAETLLVLLTCMTLGATCFVTERESNTLESLLLSPVSKLTLTFTKYMSVLLVGGLLMLTSFPYILALSYGSGLWWKSLLLAVLPVTLLLLGFCGISVILSVCTVNSKTSVLISALLLSVMTVPAFIGKLFQASAFGRFILAVDPIVCSFELSNDVLTGSANIINSTTHLTPILVFSFICVALTLLSSSKISLRGEK